MSNPSRSIVLQINGPGHENDPSVFNLSGSSLLFFPGVLVLTHGPVSIFTDGTFTQTSASSVDLCARLAG